MIVACHIWHLTRTSDTLSLNYIHGRLTSARKDKPNLAEIESVLVRQFQFPYVRGQLKPAKRASERPETDARECIQFPPCLASLFDCAID